MSSANWTTDFLNQLITADITTAEQISSAINNLDGKSKAITGNSLQNCAYSKMCVG